MMSLPSMWQKFDLNEFPISEMFEYLLSFNLESKYFPQKILVAPILVLLWLLACLYLESKLITSKHFIGTYFSHMVSIFDIGAGPQSRPLPLVTFIVGPWK